MGSSLLLFDWKVIVFADAPSETAHRPAAARGPTETGFRNSHQHTPFETESNRDVLDSRRSPTGKLVLSNGLRAISGERLEDKIAKCAGCTSILNRDGLSMQRQPYFELEH